MRHLWREPDATDPTQSENAPPRDANLALLLSNFCSTPSFGSRWRAPLASPVPGFLCSFGFYHEESSYNDTVSDHLAACKSNHYLFLVYDRLPQRVLPHLSCPTITHIQCSGTDILPFIPSLNPELLSLSLLGIVPIEAFEQVALRFPRLQRLYLLLQHDWGRPRHVPTTLRQLYIRCPDFSANFPHVLSEALLSALVEANPDLSCIQLDRVPMASGVLLHRILSLRHLHTLDVIHHRQYCLKPGESIATHRDIVDQPTASELFLSRKPALRSLRRVLLAECPSWLLSFMESSLGALPGQLQRQASYLWRTDEDSEWVVS